VHPDYALGTRRRLRDLGDRERRRVRCEDGIRPHYRFELAEDATLRLEILDDGLDHEGSLPYHLLVLEMFLVARVAAGSALASIDEALRRMLDAADIDEDQSYDLVLAACEAATNAIEHAQDPTEPFFDVTAEVADDAVTITVRDYGQWRQRVPSMDRGRGSTLMSAFADISATPSPEGTTVVIRAPRAGDDERSRDGGPAR
jgi:anti-sigma regulatory factor (Ser/Thr protein kinase)